MPDTTIKKVEAGSSPRGEMGQKYLVAGKRVSMRLWVQVLVLEPTTPDRGRRRTHFRANRRLKIEAEQTRSASPFSAASCQKQTSIAGIPRGCLG
jgi:hypothetical protein